MGIHRLEDLIETVALGLPGASEPLCLQALRDALRDFLNRTDAWRMDHDTALEAEVAEYEIVMAMDAYVKCATVCRVVEADDPAGTVGAILHNDAWRLRLVVEGRYQLTLTDWTPSDEETRALRTTLVLLPTPGEEEHFEDEEILQRFGVGIAAGAIAALAILPGRRWSSAGTAQFFRKRYAAARAEARRWTLEQGHIPVPTGGLEAR